MKTVELFVWNFFVVVVDKNTFLRGCLCPLINIYIYIFLFERSRRPLPREQFKWPFIFLNVLRQVMTSKSQKVNPRLFCQLPCVSLLEIYVVLNNELAIFLPRLTVKGPPDTQDCQPKVFYCCLSCVLVLEIQSFIVSSQMFITWVYRQGMPTHSG
jgi:hypothetical protein